MTALLEYLDRYNDNKQLEKFSFKIFGPFPCEMCLNTAILNPFCLKFTYFASVLLIAFADLFFQFFCWQNRCTPTHHRLEKSRLVFRVILLRGPHLLLGRPYYEPLLWFMIL